MGFDQHFSKRSNLGKEEKSLAKDLEIAVKRRGHLLDSSQSLRGDHRTLSGFEPSFGKTLCLCFYEE